MLKSKHVPNKTKSRKHRVEGDQRMLKVLHERAVELNAEFARKERASHHHHALLPWNR